MLFGDHLQFIGIITQSGYGGINYYLQVFVDVKE